MLAKRLQNNRKLCLDFIIVAYSNFHGQWNAIIDSFAIIATESKIEIK